jgi:hypothetical protein
MWIKNFKHDLGYYWPETSNIKDSILYIRVWLISKGSDNGVWHLKLLGFLTLSIVWYSKILKNTKRHGSAVGIVTGYRLDDRVVWVRVLVWSTFSLLHIIQTGSGAYPASYPVGIGYRSRSMKITTLTSNLCWGQENEGLWFIPPYVFMALCLNS